MTRTRVLLCVIGGAIGFGAACGGGGTGPGGGGGGGMTLVLAKAASSGDGQSAAVGTILPAPLRVMVTQNGSPLAGRAVTWSTSTSSVQLNPTNSQTGSDGVAQTAVTLPSFGAIITITASSSGATGSPVSFTATATGTGNAVTVNVVNNEFQPDIFSISRNGMVTFLWGAGAGPHTVSPVAPALIPSEPDDPARHDAPFTFDVTFPTAGSFTFFCRVHGSPTAGMRGIITVVP